MTRFLAICVATVLGVGTFASPVLAADTTKPALSSASLASAKTLRVGDIPRINWTATDDNPISSMSFGMYAPDGRFKTLNVRSNNITTSGRISSGTAAGEPVDNLSWPEGEYRVTFAQFTDLAGNMTDTRSDTALSGGVDFQALNFTVAGTVADTTKPALSSASLASAKTLRVGDIPRINWTATDDNPISSMSFGMYAPDGRFKTLNVRSNNITTSGRISSGTAAGEPVDNLSWPEGEYRVTFAQFTDLAGNMTDTRSDTALSGGVDFQALNFTVAGTVADTTKPALSSASLASAKTLRVGDIPRINWTATDDNPISSMSFGMYAPDGRFKTLNVRSNNITTSGRISSGTAAGEPVDNLSWPEGEYRVTFAQFTDLAGNMTDTRSDTALSGGVDFQALNFTVAGTVADTTKPALSSASLASAKTLRVGDIPRINWTATDDNPISSMSFGMYAPDGRFKTLNVRSNNITTSGRISSGTAAGEPVDNLSWPGVNTASVGTLSAQFTDLAGNMTDTRSDTALSGGVDFQALNFTVAPPIVVTPAAVVFTDRDGTKDDVYAVPATAGVDYLVGGKVVGAGTFPAVGTVMVTAKAKTDYVLAVGAAASWSATFKATPFVVTPAAVVFTDRDGTKDDVYAVPATAGVDYLVGGKVVGAGTFPAVGTVMVTAKAKTDYVLAVGAAASWSATFKATPFVVTPAAVVFTDRDGTKDDVYAVPATAGVDYLVGGKVVGAGTFPAVGTVMVTAKAKTDYVLAVGAAASWSATFKATPFVVTPAAVVFTDRDGTKDDVYAVPATAGVDYLVGGKVVGAGTFPAVGTVMVTAKAKTDYVLAVGAAASWSATFKATPFVVTPAAVVFTDRDGTKDDVYAVPATAGVDYLVGGKVVGAGTFPAVGTVMVTAKAKTDYVLAVGAAASWSATFKATPFVVTPAAVVFTDRDGTKDDVYAVPATAGVDYLVGGKVVGAGTFPAVGTVMVTAKAKTDYVLAVGAAASWSATFKATPFVVTPAAVVFTDRDGTKDDVYAVPATAGVDYLVGGKVVGAGTFPAVGTVMVTAKAKTDYVLAVGAAASWSATFKATPFVVTPAAVVFTDRDGTKDDVYAVPATAGVDYLVGGKVVGAGTFPAVGTVMVTAKAKTDYVLAVGAAASWSATFKATPFVVTPAAVVFTDRDGTKDDVYAVPATAGVDYLVGGKVVGAGTFPAVGTVMVTAKAKTDYVLAVGAAASWSATFKATPFVVTPAAVVFTDRDGTKDDVYAVPATAGVDYLVGGKVVGAGTFPAVGTVMVTAKAKTDYVLAVGAAASWSATFKATPFVVTPKRDFNGDGKADVLARDGAGVLWLYPGNGSGGWLAAQRVGFGWNVMNALTGAGDFNGDGKADVLARDGAGVLWLYPGNGSGGWLAAQRVGFGWNVMNALTGAGDFNGDGKADVLARDGAGVLWLYPGNGSGGWLAAQRVGFGWNVMNALTGAGDFNGDGKADVLARDGAGVLWLYPGNGSGGWLAAQRVGFGWNVMNALTGAGDFNGDGKADVLARDGAGVLWLYPGNGSGGWLAAQHVGFGWNVMNALL
ncbi:VCBS repeat-containing protein [Micrococcaceae bacterium Sec5.1]